MSWMRFKGWRNRELTWSRTGTMEGAVWSENRNQLVDDVLEDGPSGASWKQHESGGSKGRPERGQKRNQRRDREEL